MVTSIKRRYESLKRFHNLVKVRHQKVQKLLETRRNMREMLDDDHQDMVNIGNIIDLRWAQLEVAEDLYEDSMDRIIIYVDHRYIVVFSPEDLYIMKAICREHPGQSLFFAASTSLNLGEMVILEDTMREALRFNNFRRRDKILYEMWWDQQTGRVHIIEAEHEDCAIHGFNRAHPEH